MASRDFTSQQSEDWTESAEFTSYDDYNDTLIRLLDLRKKFKAQLGEALKVHKECLNMCQNMFKSLMDAEVEIGKCKVDTFTLLDISKQPLPGAVEFALKKRNGDIERVEKEAKKLKEKLTSPKRKRMNEWTGRLERCCISPVCLSRPCDPEDCVCRDMGDIYTMVKCRL